MRNKKYVGYCGYLVSDAEASPYDLCTLRSHRQKVVKLGS